MAFRRQVKNFVKNYSDAEIKVREATSNDPWGPSSSLMLAISDLTFNTISLSEIMNMLWQRLSDHGKNWRHVYKSLTLMDYLIKNGSKKVIQHCREGFCNLQMLRDFQHIDEAGRDQGHYIRQKSKQVITLLMDNQLLYNEREVACRTRLRTSYSMAFSKRLLGTGNSPTACASLPTPETAAASEKKHELLKASRLHNKKNAPKMGMPPEQCKDLQLAAEVPLSKEPLPLKKKAWKSTEDLMLFYDEDPKPILPTVPPCIISSTTSLSEGEAEVCNLWDTDVVPASSEKSPSLRTNLDKRSDNIITDTLTVNSLKTPQENQTATESFETLTTLPAFWPSSKEEVISPNLRTSKSDSTFFHQSSVETLYASPSFKTFSPVKEIEFSKDLHKSAQASTVQVEEEPLRTLATFSTTSEGTSSFSTLSVSSPDSAPPGTSAPCLPPILARPSFWTVSRQRSSSASFKHGEEAGRPDHHLTPRSPVSSDEKENDSLNLQEMLPDDSDSAKEKTSQIPSHSWVAFSTPTADHIPSMSSFSFQTSQVLPMGPKAGNSIGALLGEVKSAVMRLHEDLSMVIQELNVISSHLVSMGGYGSQASKSSPDPQSSEGSLDQT
ncbi:PREDICTED: ENTH domain-containing protein 1 [Dipodomys ordii]|uniref:ENTH domain-containing protein 1 n=1 Tax=Dipodomys ordii TaxID=10020 RepID=A0A1S3FW40_DIPOR|nr:PREDICTED: ENTH domain-containing protein 1 [Dipodomys ordii]